MAPAESTEPLAPEGLAAPAPSLPKVGRDAEWDDLLLAAFGPRYWNLGCG